MSSLRFVSLPGLAFIFAVGCGSSSNGSGAAGTGGATAGASGATAGTGGGTAGTGGATAGTGGATAGTGGATAGTGGGTAGTGGGTAGADGGAVDGGSAGAGGTPADAGAVTACNTIVNAAPPIAEMNVAGTQPDGVGGTVVPGTYFRTGTDYYTGVGGPIGPTGKARKETFVLKMLSNTTFTSEIIDSKAGAPDVRMNQAGTFVGGTAMLTVECPPTAGVFPVTYTATAGTLTIFNKLFTPHETEIYTKQP